MNEEFEWDDEDVVGGKSIDIIEIEPQVITLELNANLVKNCQLFNKNADGTLPDAKEVVELAMELACSIAESYSDDGQYDSMLAEYKKNSKFWW